MPKLTLKQEDDLIAIDTALEGTLEVLQDDGDGASMKVKSYISVFSILHDAYDALADRSYPITIDLDLSDDEAMALAETVRDLVGIDDEFTGALVW